MINGVQQKAADGNPVATPNVIVQFCTVTPNPSDVDVNGNAVAVHPLDRHRAGLGVPQRPAHRRHLVRGSASTTGTTLTSAAGAPIALAPGGAWVVLVTTGHRADLELTSSWPRARRPSQAIGVAAARDRAGPGS